VVAAFLLVDGAMRPVQAFDGHPEDGSYLLGPGIAGLLDGIEQDAYEIDGVVEQRLCVACVAGVQVGGVGHRSACRIVLVPGQIGGVALAVLAEQPGGGNVQVGYGDRCGNERMEAASGAATGIAA